MAIMFKEDPDFAVHNKRANDTAARDLKTMLEQIESAQAVKADASKDETDIYVVAKSKGYNVKALKALVRERKRDADELRQERRFARSVQTTLGDVIHDKVLPEDNDLRGYPVQGYPL